MITWRLQFVLYSNGSGSFMEKNANLTDLLDQHVQGEIDLKDLKGATKSMEEIDIDEVVQTHQEALALIEAAALKEELQQIHREYKKTARRPKFMELLSFTKLRNRKSA